MDVTAGTLLGGRVRYHQPRGGHRTGIEPVLLAAAIPAHEGERVLEGGSGAGAALLCLVHRIRGIAGVGVERDPALVQLARENAGANGAASLSFVAADLSEVRLDGVFDHAFANPPWHLPAATPSPDAGRERAKRGAPGLFALWAKRLAAPLRHGGTLTLVIAAARLPDCLAALAAAGCGSPVVLPLWPKPQREAKLALLRGVKGGRGPCRLLPGLTLHCPDGGYTEAATAILRDGAALSF
jgi:tRNA1Val (adenine37-N6)-methyltransferase